MEPFEILDHTADVGIRARGQDLKEAFANAARGMFSVITELEPVRGRLRRRVEVAAPDAEALLVQWLNELLYLFETKGLLLTRFHILSLTDTNLVAECFGEQVDPRRHRMKMGVKAATYHQVEIRREDGGHVVQVILDV